MRSRTNDERKGSLATVLAMSGSYVAPYKTPIGQVVLAVLLGVYVAVLVWMRRMAAGDAMPRFLGASVAKEQVR